MSYLSRVIVSLFLFFAFSVQAANPLDLVVNEIAWMGTLISSYDEWIELYNNTENIISLDGWQIKAGDGTPKINLKGEILGKSFFLLERTDDNTLAETEADLIYNGALENNGENLELYDNSGNLIDAINCQSGWFAGDNLTKQTLERKNSQNSGNNPGNWQNSQNPSGTPKTTNSIASQSQELKLEQKEISSPEAPEQKLEPILYPSAVVLNEVLPSPEGPDSEEEWIEIFNQNNFVVDLSGWQISDTIGSTKTYTFPEGTIINPNGYLVLYRPTTQITLNNSGDGLKLIQPAGKIVDFIEYENAPGGKSFNRIDFNWTWSDILSPGSVNAIPILNEEEIKEEVFRAESFQEKKESEGGLAAISESLQNNQEAKQFSRSSLILIIALTIAIFSGLIILALKVKLKAKSLKENQIKLK